MHNNNNLKIEELKQEVGSVFVKIILALRPDKIVNKADFNTLYLLLEELCDLMRNETVMDRKFVGRLFFMFNTIIVEASHCDYSDHIMQEVWKLSGCLMKLFDEEI